MNEECCLYCVYSRHFEIGHKDRGSFMLCQRFPPQVLSTFETRFGALINEPVSNFPVVSALSTWCGEFQKMPE
jgi:hypothetical protein